MCSANHARNLQAVLLQPVGDVNVDGTVDYNVLYPNGDVQLMLIFP